MGTEGLALIRFFFFSWTLKNEKFPRRWVWGKEAPLDLILRHKGLRKMLAMVGDQGIHQEATPGKGWGSGLGQGGGRRNGKRRRYEVRAQMPDFRKQGELGFWLWQLGCTIPWKSRPGKDVAMGRGAEFEVPKGPRWGPGAICVEPGWAREITPKRVGVGVGAGEGEHWRGLAEELQDCRA